MGNSIRSFMRRFLIIPLTRVYITSDPIDIYIDLLSALRKKVYTDQIKSDKKNPDYDAQSEAVFGAIKIRTIPFGNAAGDRSGN